MRKINISDRFGNLVVIEIIKDLNDKTERAICRCDCGNECIASAANLLRGHKKSCGCGKLRIKDHSGEVYGKVVVLNEYKRENKETYWKCKCGYCGSEFYAPIKFLKNGSIKSCGCLNTKVRKETVRERMGFVDGTSLVALSENRKLNKNSTTGIRGVTFVKAKQKYRVQIIFKRKAMHLGYFDTIEQAAEARKRAEEAYYTPLLSKEKED